MRKKQSIIFIILLFLAAGAWLVEQGYFSQEPSALVEGSDGAQALEYAFDKRLNDEWIEARVQVTRLLSDDKDGSRHQRFVVTTSAGQTLLIAHNVDLAPRVPVAIGDRIRFKGVYEWNERGGVIHWTHHDPQGRIDGGYIEHRKKTYR